MSKEEQGRKKSTTIRWGWFGRTSNREYLAKMVPSQKATICHSGIFPFPIPIIGGVCVSSSGSLLTNPKPPHLGQHLRSGFWIYPWLLQHRQIAMPYLIGSKVFLSISLPHFSLSQDMCIQSYRDSSPHQLESFAYEEWDYTLSQVGVSGWKSKGRTISSSAFIFFRTRNRITSLMHELVILQND